MTPQKLLIILAIANIPVYLIVGKIMFDDLDGVKEAAGYWLTPQWIEILRGEATDASWSNLKIFLWLLICGAAVVTEYIALAPHFVVR
jgi:hypothetical protein